MVEQEAARYVEALAEAVRGHELAQRRAWWDLATGEGVEEAARVAEASALAIDDLYGRPEEAARVRGWMEELEAGSLLRRQLERVAREQARCAGPGELRREIVREEVALQARYHGFRGRDGSGEELSGPAIEAVFEGERDVARRREAWEASMQVGDAVAEAVRRLAGLRNELARAQGHRDGFAMGLAHQGLDEGWLMGLLGRIERDTREPYRVRKARLDGRLADRFGVAEDELGVWAGADPFFQRSPGLEDVGEALESWLAGRDPADLATRFLDGLGMNLRPVMASSDLEPRAGKSQHAFCVHLDRSGDVRILSNNRRGRTWAMTMLHEGGHAVYERYLDPGLPWLLREPAHTLVTEAVAMWLGRQAMDPEFLVEFAGAPADEVTPLAAALRREQAFEMLLFARWVLVMVHFERALYADPQAGDLAETWYALKQRYQLVEVPPDRAGREDWAAKIHLALAPVYYPNYLLGELLASQLRAVLLEESGERTLSDNLAAGELLIARVFRPGARLPWERLVEEATGEALEPRHFLREFAGRVSP
ncbi:MAG: hypothetical protein EA398_04195 [Deltaproteobacteria bacterium]|nr:MAG: hypothetical protein EA398_04195 [Deltaproteobacteria bacterium]